MSEIAEQGIRGAVLTVSVLIADDEGKHSAVTDTYQVDFVGTPAELVAQIAALDSVVQVEQLSL